jgi:maltoporin
MLRAAVAVVALLPSLAHAQSEAPPKDDAPPVDTVENEADEPTYAFGSYGRVGVGTDLRGSTPEGINVVQHGSRIVEPSYVELDLYYGAHDSDDVDVDIVATLAFADNLFHYTGDFDTKLAMRNLYAEAKLPSGVNVWIGSRMYRGDSIYLLDYWALDEVNTIGGGVSWKRGRADVAAHAGANRLTDAFQLQMVDVPDNEFGAETITQLDRQRGIATLQGGYRFLGDGVGPSAKVKLFTEVQHLPSGELRREDQTIEALPSDFGWSAGAQVGAWGFLPRGSHANLFARWSQGLAAHDELAVPFGFDPSKKTFPDSSELVLGWSGNFEQARFGALVGGYLRRFVDADPSDDLDDGWEYIADVRPYAAVTDSLQGAVDVSYQKRYPRGVSPTSLMPIEPSVFQIAPMAVYSPFGLGSYQRPQFRLIYRAAHLDDDARELYPLEDARRVHKWVHFLGMQVEWWFNSTYR